MRPHAGDLCQHWSLCPELFGSSGSQLGGQRARAQGFLPMAEDSGPRHRAWWVPQPWLGELAPGGCCAGDPWCSVTGKGGRL